jgi:hypothetical protein
VRSAIGGTDTTATRAVLALQGPKAREVMAKVSEDCAAIGRFRVAHVDVHGVPCVVAGTGYTGEDGLELAVPASSSPQLWRLLVDAGAVPAGLGSRDTRRYRQDSNGLLPGARQRSVVAMHLLWRNLPVRHVCCVVSRSKGVDLRVRAQKCATPKDMWLVK